MAEQVKITQKFRNGERVLNEEGVKAICKGLIDNLKDVEVEITEVTDTNDEQITMLKVTQKFK